MNLSIAITAMVNTTAATSQPNASAEGPPADSQDFWNETVQESKVLICFMRVSTISLIQGPSYEQMKFL